MTFSLPALGAFLRGLLTFGREAGAAAARTAEANAPTVGRAAAEDEPEGATKYRTDGNDRLYTDGYGDRGYGIYGIHVSGVETDEKGKPLHGVVLVGRRGSMTTGTDGKRKVTFTDGEVYEGGFRDVVPHGPGKMAFPDGRVYEGEWRDGKPARGR